MTRDPDQALPTPHPRCSEWERVYRADFDRRSALTRAADGRHVRLAPLGASTRRG